MKRELTDAQIREQALALHGYTAKLDNHGASAWADSKDFGDEDRAAVLLAFSEIDTEAE